MPLPCSLLTTASITEPVVDFATNVIGDLGLAGIFLLMLLDSACIPTSSEAIMLFAGFKVADGRFTMLEIVVAGSAGNVVGSWVAYGLGYFGRIELIERHGRWLKWLHITPAHIAWADRWFERYGGSTVFFSRMLPVIRTFISLPAGVAKMPFWKFTVAQHRRHHSLGARVRPARKPGRRPLGRLAAEAPLRRLRDSGGHRDRHRLPAAEKAPRPQRRGRGARRPAPDTSG